ncbi:a chain structure and mechanism of mrna cap (guanine n-7) methyltransferase [Vairimorpha apis BRL 01]|uniref:mRNA cap guanine-N(7) methyltransferase n=1 Tax=Vairimorpha apis BRL 01 TaxID=1037528 RepID=T0L691_9MICR|nr:a chain structure and mechanism of mrna cap (guanine n-7) methyltransferase [Vairimorpha apis BRL 01]
MFIKQYTKSGMKVLDIGCGKGGDLGKYDKCNISEYYGLDIAEVSIYDCKLRFNNSSYTFKGFFDWCDTYNSPFDLKKQFDLISSQFSFHYAFSSINSIQTTIKNINIHLKVGGYFIFSVPNREEILKRYENGDTFNSLYSITYDGTSNDYYFFLEGCVNNCVEYFVDFEKLVKFFDKYNIILIRRTMFKVFYDEMVIKNEKMAKIMKCRYLNDEEMKIVSLYEIGVFKKIS